MASKGRIMQGLLAPLAAGLGLGGLAFAGAGDEVTEPNPAPQRVIVTRDDPEARPCARPERIGSLFMRFNRALNAADAEALGSFWQERRKGLENDRGPHARGTFVWYSIGNSPSPGHKRRFTAYSPESAIRYVAERRGFRLQLTEVKGGAYQGHWLNDDGRVFDVVGKADKLCKPRGLIGVWSMGVRDEGVDSGWNLCPDPPGGRPDDALIACR